MAHVAYLALGSNVGDRVGHLTTALRHINTLGTIKAVSAVYETEPMEVVNQPWFLNCAAMVETELEAEALMSALLDIEQKMGRRRTQPKGPRTIDLDILFYDDVVLDTPLLTLPHPELHRRRFVLAPLADIAPKLVHPTLQRSVKDLLSGLAPASDAVQRHTMIDLSKISHRPSS